MSAIPVAVPSAPSLLRLRGSDGFVAPAARVRDLPGPRPLPVVGNTFAMKPGSMHTAVEDWVREYGPMYKLRLGPMTSVVIADPVLIGEVLRHRPVGFARGKKLVDVINEIATPGLFTAEGERWRRQRKLVMRALTPEAIRHFFPTIRTVTGRLLAKWQAASAEGRAVDVTRDLKRYSIDVTTWLSMGVDVDTLNHPENPLQSDVELWFETVGRRFRSPLPYWRWIRLPADRRADEALGRLRDTMEKLIADARAGLDADPSLRARPRNILEALIVARDEPGSEFTDDDVTGNVGTLLFAGEDTAANAMAWQLMHLATSPDHAARAAAQVDEVRAGAPLVQSFADLERLDYVEATAVESMRLKPIAPLQGAMALVEADLAGLRIEPGQVLTLAWRPGAMDPRLFDEPRRFEPQRWTGEHAESADDTRRKIFPFGAGPRYCPGRYLAMVEMKMVAAAALGNFRLSLEADADAVVEHLTFTMGPERLPIRFEPRR